MAKQFFTTDATATAFVVTERETDWMPGSATGRGWSAVSKGAAWQAARSQTLPVQVRHLSGEVTELGEVFSGAAYEQTAYRAYVSHGRSMTDGHFAPKDSAAWVAQFRKAVLAGGGETLLTDDLPETARNAFGRYASELARVAGPSAS